MSLSRVVDEMGADGQVGAIGALTLVAVLRACWLRNRRKEVHEEEEERRHPSYAAYLGNAPPSYSHDWAGGDGVPSTSEPSSVSKGGALGLGGAAMSATTSRASTSAPHGPLPPSPTVSITPAPPVVGRRPSPPGLGHRPSSPQSPTILLSTLHPLTPTASPGDIDTRPSPPRRRTDMPGHSDFPGHLDLPTPGHARRVSFTADERPRPSRAALERLQERSSEDSVLMGVGPGGRRGSLSRLLEAGEPLSRRITHVGEPLARRISRATDQSEADVWDDIGIAPPTSTAAVLEGRRASRSSTDRGSTDVRGRVSPDIRRGSVDSSLS